MDNMVVIYIKRSLTILMGLVVAMLYGILVLLVLRGLIWCISEIGDWAKTLDAGKVGEYFTIGLIALVVTFFWGAYAHQWAKKRFPKLWESDKDEKDWD